MRMKRLYIVVLFVLLFSGCKKQQAFELRDGVTFSFVEKENRSNEIVFTFVITNNNDSIYSKENKIHVHIGEYGGVFQIDDDVSDKGKGEIIIEGSLTDERFKELYDSDLEDITYKVEEYLG